MNERSPKSIIPEHIVENLANNLNTQYVEDFMERVDLEMRQKQPQLHKELLEIAMEKGDTNGTKYMFGAFLSFNVIDAWLQQEGKKILITEEDLAVHWENVADFWDDQRWNDPNWAEEQLAVDNTPKSTLSLAEKLDIYSPSFISVLGIISASLPTYELKSDFISGARDVALPFFAKIETEELDKKLYQ